VALGAAALTLRAPERSGKLRAIVGLLIACAVATAAYELLYAPLHLQGAKDQFSSINLLRRLFPPTLTQFARLNTLVFATGVLPALALFAVRRKDGLAWTLAVVTALYFGLVYAQVWASVHQFTPAMILPLAVFWRTSLDAGGRRRWILCLASIGLTAACLILSLPRHDRINVAIREAGEATDFRIADYDEAYPAAMRAARAVYWLFPEGYRLEYPEQPWGTDGYSWLYYASRPKPAGAAIAYVVQDPAAAPPAGSRLAGRDSLAAVWVIDERIWRRQREPDVPRVVASPLYEPVLREMYRFFREYTERVRREEAASGRS
jgi:hypothetical protein